MADTRTEGNHMLMYVIVTAVEHMVTNQSDITLSEDISYNHSILYEVTKHIPILYFMFGSCLTILMETKYLKIPYQLLMVHHAHQLMVHHAYQIIYLYLKKLLHPLY